MEKAHGQNGADRGYPLHIGRHAWDRDVAATQELAHRASLPRRSPRGAVQTNRTWRVFLVTTKMRMLLPLGLAGYMKKPMRWAL